MGLSQRGNKAFTKLMQIMGHAGSLLDGRMTQRSELVNAIVQIDPAMKTIMVKRLNTLIAMLEQADQPSESDHA